MNRDCYIVDIDGTIADGSHRIHHIQSAPKDWDTYFSLCHLDKPITHMVDLISRMSLTTHMVFASGRREDTRVATIKWLRAHGFHIAFDPPNLYMRGKNDFRNDDIIKLEMLKQMRIDGWNPVMAFDDRDRIVKMWRANGIPCCQVAEGDF